MKTLFRPLSASLFMLVFVATSWGQQQADTRLWARGEYLHWWVKSADVPPLVTTGPVNVSDPSDRSGELGNPDTRILLGLEPVSFGTTPGGRVTLGGWIDNDRRIGVEGSYTFLNRGKAGATLSAPGTPGSMQLLLPFFNPVTREEDSTGIAVTSGGGFSGVANLALSTKIASGEINGIFRMFQGGNFQLNALAGYRHFKLDEEFLFTTDSTNVPPAPPDVFLTRDDFRTNNHLHAAQVGARSTLSHNAWSLNVDGKLAFGSMQTKTEIRGALDTNDFNDLGPVQTFAGAYFALPTNIGSHKRDQFAILPEVTAGVTFDAEPVRLFAGYTFLFANHVARAGDEIDRTINPSQGPGFTGDPAETLLGPARPAFLGTDASFWAQSIGFGVEVRF